MDCSLLIQQYKIKNKYWKESYCNKITKFKANTQKKNAINLSTATLTEAQKSLLMNGSLFVTTSDVHQYQMWKDFDIDTILSQRRLKCWVDYQLL